MQERFVGGYLGAALGDAFGMPVAELSREKISEKWGLKGVEEPILHPVSKNYPVSALTEEMCFVGDGILWADSLPMEPILPVKRSLIRWFYLRTDLLPSHGDARWLNPQLHETGGSLLKKLKGSREGCYTSADVIGSGFFGTVDMRINDAREGDAASRVLPYGLYYAGAPERAFSYGMDCAAMTHGDWNTILTAGCYSLLISSLAEGAGLREAFVLMMKELSKYAYHQALKERFEKAYIMAGKENSVPEELGKGFFAEEQFALAIYAVYHEREFEKAMQLGVNQDGVSSEIAAFIGGIMGTLLGKRGIPKTWIYYLEFYDILENQALKLYEAWKRRQ